MLHLKTTDIIRVNTASSGAVKVHASWLDLNTSTVSGSVTNTASITGTGNTTVVGSPGSGMRNVRLLSVRNDHASVSNLIVIDHYDGTNASPLWSGTLLPGESVNLNEGGGWCYLDATGAPKLATPKLDQVTYLKTDMANGGATILQDVRALTAPVQSGKKYAFEAYFIYQTTSSGSGAKFGVDGPSMTSVITACIENVTPSVTAATSSSGVVTTINTVVTANSTSPGAVNAVGIVSGMINPSADGTFGFRVASGVTVTITVKAGSWLRIRELDN